MASDQVIRKKEPAGGPRPLVFADHWVLFDEGVTVRALPRIQLTTIHKLINAAISSIAVIVLLLAHHFHLFTELGYYPGKKVSHPCTY